MTISFLTAPSTLEELCESWRDDGGIDIVLLAGERATLPFGKRGSNLV
jgi:hypothetical protein